MAALQAPVATVIENIYIEKSTTYLNRKTFAVVTILKDQVIGELDVKSKIPYNQQVL